MVVVFDLDDTLYEERTYVRSGFAAVAKFLNKKYGWDPESLAKEMNELEEKLGRGKVFDTALANRGVTVRSAVRECVSVYRAHEPGLTLLPDAERALRRLQHLPCYLVTDGNKLVQAAKVKALGLDRRLKFCYLTSRYGLISAKPSPYLFMEICDREGVSPAEVVYIGDDPNKDFIGIKPLGFQTVRILRGRFRDVRLDERHEAARTISSLDELVL